jgi:hypothetical protein
MTRFWLTVGAVVVASIAMLIFGMNEHARFDLREASDGDLADRYRLVCGAYRDLQIDAVRIPAELQSLIPLATKYGHGERIMLEDCAMKMDKSQANRIVSEISEKRAHIEQWLSTFPQNFYAEEVVAFRELLKLHGLLRTVTVEPGKSVL